MSDWYEQEYVEPDSGIKINSGTKAEIKLAFNTQEIENALSAYISQYVENNLKPKLEIQVQKKFDEEMRRAWGENTTCDKAFKEVLLAELLRRYPEVVENKINEFYKSILELKVVLDKDHKCYRDMVSSAHKKVDDYIENELKGAVKKSTEYIEQFSKNYFANNLFRAMGMMDKLMPIANPDGKSSLT